jgi:uncharacterized membrane protein HdeD (DUF308 family)
MRMPHRIRSPFTHRRIGRRGACLLILGVLHLNLGWTLLSLPPTTLQALKVFRYVPVAVWGSLWMILGAISLLYAFVRRSKSDGLGFAAAYLMPSLWGLAYLLSWWPFRDIGIEAAVRAAGIYWCYALLIQIIAGWAEEPSAERVAPDELDD